MSIRIKLLLTYAILLLISASVLFFSGMAIVIGLFKESAEIILQDNHFEEVAVEVIDLLAELKQAEDYEPQKLKDPEFLEALNNKLEFLNGGLIVRYKEQIIDPTGLPKERGFYENLKQLHSQPDIDYDSLDHEEMAFKYLDKKYVYFDYRFQLDGDEILYYFVADVTRFKDMGQEGGKNFFKGLLLLLILIMSPLIWIITSDIIKPLRTLEKGVNNIKEGNLDFELTTRKRNEIGRVIMYFDKMRQELKKSIEKQVQYEDNRKELISSISHDLKTPITSIKGHVEGIRDGIANTPEKMDKYLNVIYQKSQDMDQLIDDLFLFSKFDLERVPFDMQEIAILPLVSEVVDEIRLEWQDENRKIHLLINDAILEKTMVYIDQQHMKRVLVNLLHNSIKYMDKVNQEIQVILNDNQEFVQIIVADNGMGIDDVHLEQIFDRFYRVDESRNSKMGGTGLGLAITKQIIEQHQGHIFATSVLGEGTKMIIELKKHHSFINLTKGDNAIE